MKIAIINQQVHCNPHQNFNIFLQRNLKKNLNIHMETQKTIKQNNAEQYLLTLSLTSKYTDICIHAVLF